MVWFLVGLSYPNAIGLEVFVSLLLPSQGTRRWLLEVPRPNSICGCDNQVTCFLHVIKNLTRIASPVHIMTSLPCSMSLHTLCREWVVYNKWINKQLKVNTILVFVIKASAKTRNLWINIIVFSIGVFICRGKEDALVTRNMVIGESVYGEKRINVEVSLLYLNPFGLVSYVISFHYHHQHCWFTACH